MEEKFISGQIGVVFKGNSYYLHIVIDLKNGLHDYFVPITEFRATNFASLHKIKIQN